MLNPLRIIKRHLQSLSGVDAVMIITFRADVEILFDLALEEHLFAARAFDEQPFGANGLLFAGVYRLRLVFSLKPTHSSRGRESGVGGRLEKTDRPLAPGT